MESSGNNFFVIIGVFLLGYAIGIIESRITARLRKSKEKEPEVQVVEKVVEVERMVEAPVVFSVNFEGNRPLVKLDGQSVDYYDVTHEQRKRLIDILTYIRPWIDARIAPARPQSAPPAAQSAVQPAAQPQQPTPPPVQPAAPPPAQPQPARPVVPPSPEVQRTTLQGRLSSHQQPSQPLSPSAPEPPKVEPVSMNVITSARYMMQNRGKEEPRLMSIVEQIDAVLQKRLPLSPFADIEISLRDAPNGGVLVIVGDQQFQGIDNVTDPQIQAFIRDCIQRWEKG